MRTVELFCGTKSFSKIAEERGHNTFTIDVDQTFQPDLHKNILSLIRNDLPKDIDILWASPPCEGFSVATIGRYWEKNWNGDHSPKHRVSEYALRLIKHTLNIISATKPRFWFIENPRGMLRKMSDMKRLNRLTTTYCQYGDTRMKPTDIWTNSGIVLKPPCKNGAPCHIRAPRGSKTGTQGLKNSVERGRIPRFLIEDIIKYCENQTLTPTQTGGEK